MRESWIGCDVHVIIPQDLRISAADSNSVWTTDVGELIARSPKNARYLFIPRRIGVAEAEAAATELQSRIDTALAALPADDATHWRERLLVTPKRNFDLEGWVKEAMQGSLGAQGLTVDRQQRLRGMGSLAAVEAYDAALAQAGAWPYPARLYNAAREVEYLNFEAERAQALAAGPEPTEVVLFEADLHEEYEDIEVQLPDPATLAKFDTLHVEVLMECPDRTKAEVGNCGAWDYLAYLFVEEPGTGKWLELSRFITTYHRESWWISDATHALAWLKDGGKRKFRYLWAPPWNTQPTIITVKLRLTNEGKGFRPTSILPLYEGGPLNRDYNAARPPKSVAIPAGAKKVELRSIITGHGAETQNCAEFCDHQHTFTVGGAAFERKHPEGSGTYACQEDVVNGTVPNQSGTWWFGRGGWCPGREVFPWVEDVTATAKAGADVEVSYAAKVAGRDPNGTFGTIEMRSWLVVYE
jgi:hypothetical protein